MPSTTAPRFFLPYVGYLFSFSCILLFIPRLFRRLTIYYFDAVVWAIIPKISLLKFWPGVTLENWKQKLKEECLPKFLRATAYML